MLGNNNCDSSCNNYACSFDYGDCDSQSNCATGCPEDMIGNGYCNQKYNNGACSYDDGDYDSSEYNGDFFSMPESQDNTEKAKKSIASKSAIGIFMAIIFGSFSITSTIIF